MKRCSYCGTEYPDDAIVCAIDQTPLGEIPSGVSTPLKPPRFAVFSEYKIPVSLAVLSYLFFIPAAMCFAFIAIMIWLLVLFGSPALGGMIVLMCILAGAVGSFFLCLSRGLRSCSRRWRTCALVFIWLGFISTAFFIGEYLLIHKTPDHETTKEFLLGCVFNIAWQAWQYRVLTRPDIRDLFYG